MSEYARLAKQVLEGTWIVGSHNRKLVADAIMFRANATEEVIARAISLSRDCDPDDCRVDGKPFWQTKWILEEARAVLAALEGSKP